MSDPISDVIFVALLVLFPVLMAILGVGLARVDMYGGWHTRWTHKCGHHEYSYGLLHKSICPKCGEHITVSDIELWTAQARFPLGWRWGKRIPY